MRLNLSEADARRLREILVEHDDPSVVSKADDVFGVIRALAAKLEQLLSDKERSGAIHLDMPQKEIKVEGLKEILLQHADDKVACFVYDKLTQEGRIYSYGAKAPIENEDLVRSQLRTVNRYRNALVAVELDRRKKTNETLSGLSPELVEAEDAEAKAEAELEEIDAEFRRNRVKVRGRPKATPVERVRKKTAKALLKELRGKAKALKKKLFGDPGWKKFQLSIGKWWKGEKARAKQDFEADLPWGTRAAVVESTKSFSKKAPPRFRASRGISSKVGVQISGGMSLEELYGCQGTQLRLERPEGGVWTGPGRVCRDGQFRRRKLGDALVWIRVASEKRKPVWAKFPVRWHRELPPGSRIQRAYVMRHVIGTKEVWSLKLVLVAKEGTFDRPDRSDRGAVGIDVGWRRYPDRLRVAVWAASDGSEGELCLPNWWLEEMRRVSRIESHRDLLLDEAKKDAKPRIAALPGAPEWLVEAGKAMHNWRAAARLASVVLRWRSERVENKALATDEAEAQVADLEAWREHDKHHLEYGVNLRDQLQGSRLDLYRRYAVRMSQSFATAVIEDLDLAKLQRDLPVEEGGSKAEDAMTKYMRDACISKLFGALKEHMCQVVEANPANTTKQCHACGKVDEAWVDHAAVDHECPFCGMLWDQDVNAARNLLAAGGEASGEAVIWTRPPLAPTDRMTYGTGSNRAMRRTAARAGALKMERLSPAGAVG